MTVATFVKRSACGTIKECVLTHMETGQMDGRDINSNTFSLSTCPSVVLKPPDPTETHGHMYEFKGSVHPKIINILYIFHLTCSDIYQSKLFWCELPSFGDISRKKMCNVFLLL